MLTKRNSSLLSTKTYSKGGKYNRNLSRLVDTSPNAQVIIIEDYLGKSKKKRMTKFDIHFWHRKKHQLVGAFSLELFPGK